MNLRVKEICREKGLTMEHLAKMLEITPNTLTRNINGNPTVETLEKIAAALDVDIIDLFGSNRGDFTAFIDQGGKLYRFDSMKALQDFIWGQVLE